MRNSVLPLSSVWPALCVISLALTIGGCAKPCYELILGNDGAAKIVDAEIVFSGHTMRFGNLVPKASKGDFPVCFPIPEIATVVWKYESGTEYKKSVEIKKHVPKPKTFDGSLWDISLMMEQ